MTGVKAALMRNVNVDAVNTAGWTPLHAAAAGGSTHVLRVLIRAKADITIRDCGGNLAAHEAARGGHLHCLEALSEAGVPLSEIRLSQTKGPAVRALVANATRSAAKAKLANEDDQQEEEATPVGYARQKQKSCGFWGPRRTPISCKLKRELLKEKRKRQETSVCTATGDEIPECELKSEQVLAEEPAQFSALPGDSIAEKEVTSRSYVETIRAVKRSSRMTRKARQMATRTAGTEVHAEEVQAHDENSDVVQEVDVFDCGHTTKLWSRHATAGFLALAESSDEESTTDTASDSKST